MARFACSHASDTQEICEEGADAGMGGGAVSPIVSRYMWPNRDAIKKTGGIKMNDIWTNIVDGNVIVEIILKTIQITAIYVEKRILIELPWGII